jgi:hypothetical protein
MESASTNFGALEISYGTRYKSVFGSRVAQAWRLSTAIGYLNETDTVFMNQFSALVVSGGAAYHMSVALSRGLAIDVEVGASLLELYGSSGATGLGLQLNAGVHL